MIFSNFNNAVEHHNKSADIVIYSISSLKSICANFQTKCLMAIIYAAFSFAFDPDHLKALSAVWFLIIADFITGLAAAKKSGEEIKSSKVFRSAIKCLVYFLFIACAHVTEKTVPDFLAYADETIIAFLAVTEFISIIENIGKMGFAVPQKMLNKLQAFRDKQ